MVWPQIVFQILPLVVLALLLVFIKRKILWRRFPWTLLSGGALLLLCAHEITYQVFGRNGASFRFGFTVIMVYALALTLLGESSGASRIPRLTERLYALEARLARLTAAPLPEGQTEFTVTLEAYPADRKLTVIKMITEITGVSLREAKHLVEGAPSTIKRRISKADAEAMVVRFDETGAKLEIT